MATFVHLTPQSRLAHIRREGIGRLRKASAVTPAGFFAVPLTGDFFLSHQWLRELKRRGCGPIAGVYFRISDREGVWIGHYGRVPRRVTAARAVAEFMAEEDRLGWEVVVPRRVSAGEIVRVRTLPQVAGWRYWPKAHGVKPCGCRFCQRGQYGGRRLREQYDRE
jgi:hypothetical protein